MSARRFLVASALLALAGAGCGAEPRAARGAPRVVVVSEAAGFVHDSIPAAVAFVSELGAEPLNGGFAALSAARLREVDVVVFANTSGEPIFTGVHRSALLRWVRAGGAIVATHSASDAFRMSWPAYGDLIGAVFSHHGPIQTRTLRVDRSSPVTRGLPSRWRHRDEYYRFRAPPRRSTRVLIRTGDGLPLVWTRHEGRGRIFYSALGHPIAAWAEAIHRRLLRQAVAWAAEAR